MPSAMTTTKNSSMSGDEPDAAGLLGTDLDVGERGGGHEVELALVVAELDELGAGVESRCDDLLDLGRRLRRLEVDLAGRVGDADPNVHGPSVRQRIAAPVPRSLSAHAATVDAVSI